MTFAPRPLYPTNPKCLMVLFDLRDPNAVEGLHRGRAIWQEESDIEALDEDHFVLIVRLGAAARRLAA